MSAKRYVAATAIVGLLAGGAFGADAKKPIGKTRPAKPIVDVDPLWPTNMAPHNWHTNPGTRYQMNELVKIVDPSKVIFRAKIADWRKDRMGTFKVGDQYHFSAILAALPDRGVFSATNQAICRCSTGCDFPTNRSQRLCGG